MPPTRKAPAADQKARLKLFDQAMERQRAWAATQPRWTASRDRGWKREDLYGRGRAR